MKINSENLYELINDGTIKAGTKLKAYKDDVCLTQIMFDGYDFQWQSGTFTSGDLFNPLVDFKIIEEEKEIEELSLENNFYCNELGVGLLKDKINELVRELNKIKKEGK